MSIGVEILLPEAYGRRLWLEQRQSLAKGAAHKYLKRYKGKNGKWRYVYHVGHAGGVAHEEHVVEGSAFKAHGGHYHVTARSGDSVTLRHDETGKTRTMHVRQLTELLRQEHAEAIQAHHGRVKRELAAARKHGTARQVAKLEREARRAGVQTGGSGWKAALRHKYPEAGAAEDVSATHGVMELRGKWFPVDKRTGKPLAARRSKAEAVAAAKRETPADAGKAPEAAAKPEPKRAAPGELTGDELEQRKRAAEESARRRRKAKPEPEKRAPKAEEPAKSLRPWVPPAPGSKAGKGREDVKVYAKRVRQDIAAAVRAGHLPPAKYTVRLKRYSGGRSIAVEVSAPSWRVYRDTDNPRPTRAESWAPASLEVEQRLNAIVGAHSGSDNFHASPVQWSAGGRGSEEDAARPVLGMAGGAGSAGAAKRARVGRNAEAEAKREKALAERAHARRMAKDPKYREDDDLRHRKETQTPDNPVPDGKGLRGALSLLVSHGGIGGFAKPGTAADAMIRHGLAVQDGANIEITDAGRAKLAELNAHEAPETLPGLDPNGPGLRVVEPGAAAPKETKKAQAEPSRAAEAGGTHPLVSARTPVKMKGPLTRSAVVEAGGYGSESPKLYRHELIARNLYAYPSTPRPSKGDRVSWFLGGHDVTVARVNKRTATVQFADGRKRAIPYDQLGLASGDRMAYAMRRASDAEVMAVARFGGSKDEHQQMARDEVARRGLPDFMALPLNADEHAASTGAEPPKPASETPALDSLRDLGLKVSPNDVDARRATAAHQHTSWTPERRAALEQSDYVGHMENMARRLLKHADTPEKKQIVADELRSYKYKHLAKRNAHMDAKSRTASWAITGRSGFNVRRNEKRTDTADRRGQDVQDHAEAAFSAIKRRLRDHGAPPKSVTDSVEHKRAQVEQAKAEHAATKADRTASAADVRRAHQRVKAAEDRLAVRERREEAETTVKRKVGEVEHIDNPELNRVQIVFPGKPDAETRQILKTNGFRWAPSQGAWQRQRTTNGDYAARRVMDALAAKETTR